MKTALIAGATGLVGGQLLSLLLNSDRYSVVKAITRNPIHQLHSKLKNIVVDFDRLDQVDLSADDVFCCLGTTIKKVRTKEKFRKVDHDYPLELARMAKQQGASQFLLVSALGANKQSNIFYNRVKGEVEEAISAIGFDSLHIFRPSLLIGPRTEKRAGEDAAKFIYKYLGSLYPRSTKRSTPSR